MNEKRVVFYNVLISGDMKERVGIFDVTFDDDGQPSRAEMPRFVGYSTTRELVEFYEQIEKAIMERPALHCNTVLNLDSEMWDGILFFKPKIP